MFDSCEAMVAGLTGVVGQPASALDADGLLDRLSTISALKSVLAAAEADTMVDFHHAVAGTSADLGHDGPRPGDRAAAPGERRWSGDVLRSVSDEIGLVLHAHRRTATRWINRAAVLVERFPTTHGLLSRGGLPAAAAQHIAHELAIVVDDELRAAVEKVVLAWGRRYGWTKIKQTAQREAAKVVAEYESLLHAHRHMERTTYTVTHDGGMADLVVSTSAIDITAIMIALTERALQLQRQGDHRSLDELRTDLAVSRLLGNDHASTGDSTHDDPATSSDSAGEQAASSHAAPSAWPAADDAYADTDAASDANPTTASTTDPASETEAEADAGTTAAAETGADAETTTAETGADGAANPAATTQPATDTDCGADCATDTADDGRAQAGACADGAGRQGAAAPPVSGMNPAVGVQVVIHCTYAEAEALATGAITTGGQLEGYGPLPQDALAMAFARAKFRYRLTDRLPKSDPTRHDPSPGLAQHVRDRDRHCRFPGCNAPAIHCDLDHRTAFPNGPTDADNLEPLCRHHHRLKHHGDWQIFKTDDGSLIWISPTGRAHIDPPAMPDAA